MKKKIAFFDFDGTITTKDSFVEFLRFTQGSSSLYLGFLRNAAYLVAYKLKLIPNQKAKEKVLEYFFGQSCATDFDELCKKFSEAVLPQLIRPKAVEEIKTLQQKGFNVVVVSASPENWIRPWTDRMGVSLIASCLETINGTVTGKLNGKNCRGEEKVRRILELHRMDEYEEIYAYGDKSGDKPMMKLATKSFYKPFRK